MYIGSLRELNGLMFVYSTERGSTYPEAEKFATVVGSDGRGRRRGGELLWEGKW